MLVVDDLDANVELLTRKGYMVTTARDGEAALASVQDHAPDALRLDVVMHDLNGFEVWRRLKRRPTRLPPVVLLTALQDRSAQLGGIDAGADEVLSTRCDTTELFARLRSLIRLKRDPDDLDLAEAVIVNLALTIEARAQDAVGHGRRVADSATALGAQLGLGTDDLEALRCGGFLHDLGKIGIPEAVLLKAGKLTTCERQVIERHPVIGDELCGKVNVRRRVRPIVRHHHERLDGSGYPDGLRGDAIPLLAQIASIVDIYDALTTRRLYRKAWTPEQACEELMAEVRPRVATGRPRRGVHQSSSDWIAEPCRNGDLPNNSKAGVTSRSGSVAPQGPVPHVQRADRMDAEVAAFAVGRRLGDVRAWFGGHETYRRAQSVLVAFQAAYVLNSKRPVHLTATRGRRQPPPKG